jgi:predicted RecA/RadA family phage recombinase
MKNYVQKGDRVTLTAPAGGVVSGTGYLIGNLFVVATASAAAGIAFSAQTGGVVTLPKNATQAMAEGAAVYWDDVAKNVTTTVGSNKKLGQAVSLGGVLAAATAVDVYLAPQ